MTTPPPPPPPPSEPMGQPAGSGDDKTMALISHFGIILFGFIPPLIIYLIKGDSPWAKREAAKAFNFTIIFTAVFVALTVLRVLFIAVDDSGVIGLATACVSCLLWPAAWITNLVFGIMNGIKANNGEETKYPFEIPILK